MFTEIDLSMYEFSHPDFPFTRSVVDSITQDNLLAVQGHAIRGFETMKEYVEDARQSGDHELVEYLERVSRAYVQAADEAAQLLLGRLAMPKEN